MNRTELGITSWPLEVSILQMPKCLSHLSPNIFPDMALRGSGALASLLCDSIGPQHYRTHAANSASLSPSTELSGHVGSLQQGTALFRSIS